MHANLICACSRFEVSVPEIPLPMFEPLVGLFKDRSLEVFKPALRSVLPGKFVDADGGILPFIYGSNSCYYYCAAATVALTSAS